MSIIIWIDQKIYNDENKGYIKELEELGHKNIRLFQKVSDAIDYIKSIRFEETKIIVSGSLFSELINIFKANIKDICFVPQIIVFTRKRKKFFEYNPDYEKIGNKFYTSGGIATKIGRIKNFLNKKISNNISNESSFISQNSQKNTNDKIISLNTSSESNETNYNSDIELTFEYIDSKDKLILPMLFKTLIDKASNENIEEYTKSLYNIYSKENEKVKNLLEQILIMTNVPTEILSKYYARLYTLNSNFYKELNKDLRLNYKDKYLPYIKTFYEGVRLKSFPLADINILYRGGNLSNDEINKIKN